MFIEQVYDQVPIRRHCDIEHNYQNFRILCRRDGTHIKILPNQQQEAQKYKQYLNKIETRAVENNYEKVNSLLYDLHKEYLEIKEVQIIEEV